MKRLLLILGILLCAPLASATTIYVAQTAGSFSGGTACNGQTAISVSTFNSTTLSAGETVYLCGTITSQIVPKNGGSSGNPVLIQWDTGTSVQVCNTGGGAVYLDAVSYVTLDLGGNSTADECPNNGTGLSTDTDGTIAIGSNGNGWSNIEIRNGTVGPEFLYSGTADLGFNSLCINGAFGANSTYIHNITLTGCAEGMEIDPTANSTDQFSYITDLATVGRMLNYANGATSSYTASGTFHDNNINFTSVWVVPGDYEHFEVVHQYNTGDSGSDQDKMTMLLYNNYFWGSSPSTSNAGSTALLFMGEGGSSCSANSTNSITAFNNVIVDSGNEDTGFSQGTGGYFYMQDCEQTYSVYNNTIVMNGTSNPCYRFLETAGTTGNTWNVKNNVCVGGGGASYGAYFDALPTMNFSNNDYYDIGSGEWQIGSTTYTFAQWQSHISGDSASITTIPGIFTSNIISSTASAVYQAGVNLTSLNVTALDTGAPLAMGQTGMCWVACVARSATVAWDMGAYPYSSQAPTPVTTYASTIRTDVTAQGYPATIPCPYNGTGCTAGSGSLTGANYCFTPTDFNNEMCRITDAVALTGGNHLGYWLNCGGSAEVNFMNTADTMFFVCDTGNNVFLMSWNAATLTASQIGTAPFNGYGYPFWSYNQPNIAYGITTCASSSDPCLVGLNFANPTSPVVTTLQDLTACSGVAGATVVGDFSIAGDDATFNVLLQTTSGQGTSGAHYLVVYNLTAGCRTYDTQAMTMSGSWGTVGSASYAQGMVLHNARINKPGTYIKIAPQHCLAQGTLTVTNGSTTATWVSGTEFGTTGGWAGSAITINGVAGTYTISSVASATSLTLNTAWTGTSGTYSYIGYVTIVSGSCDSSDDNDTWQVTGLNVYRVLSPLTTDECGHTAIGANNVVNQCAVSSKNQWYIRPSDITGGTGTSLTSNFPPYTASETFDQHMSWPNDNLSDNVPFCTSAYGWLESTGPTFAPVEARQDEILCIATGGGGQGWRFAHNYSTNLSNFFSSQFSIDALSQDGKWIAWSTDFDGMLGNINLTSAACAVGTVSLTNGSSAVTWASGTTFTTGTGWDGNSINLDGTDYTISSVSSTTALTLGGNYEGTSGTWGYSTGCRADVMMMPLTAIAPPTNLIAPAKGAMIAPGEVFQF